MTLWQLVRELDLRDVLVLAALASVAAVLVHGLVAGDYYTTVVVFSAPAAVFFLFCQWMGLKFFRHN